MDDAEIIQLIQDRIPDAQVRVRPYAGDDHFEVEVVSPAFDGLSRINQHRMVYQALEGVMRGRIHALVLKTRTPEQKGVA